MLWSFHTCFAVGRESFWAKVIDVLPVRLQSRLANRVTNDVPASIIKNHIFLEFAWQARQANSGPGQLLMHWRNERFQLQISDAELATADVVIGFDTSSWLVHQRCRSIGSRSVMVQSTIHPDEALRINRKLALEYPEWAVTYERRDSIVRAAEEIEFSVSAEIICSSNFTRQTLLENGVSCQKIHVIPHGVDIASFSPAVAREEKIFRFVFVGSITVQKGVPLLLEAWRRLAPLGAELWLIGPLSPAAKELLPTLPGLRVFGQVPSADVPKILQQCDVFVFPSFFEGFGLVILQAMACSLPVITTTSTAGPDLISTPGDGGWIIPTGELEPLMASMEYCLARRADMPEIGRRARAIAESYSWLEYGRNWSRFLHEWLEGRN